MPASSTPTDGERPVPDGAPARPDPMARREAQVRDVLRRCVKELRPPGGGEAPAGPAVPLRLEARVEPGAWDVRFDPPLAEQLREQLGEALAARGAYREGAVHCYRCGQAGCAHARPPDPDAVFAGYDPMGQPEWKALAQALLELRDPRIDRLFEPGAPVLARVQPGRELRARQLPSFGRGSRTYGLLAQAIAGFVRPGPHEARFALTFQAVEAFGADGGWELRLNLLACAPEGDTAAWLADERLAWLRRARDAARRDLARVEARARAARAARDGAAFGRALGGVPAVLRRLAQSLERGGRQVARRTRHADERRASRRPVHMAVADALRARSGPVYVDMRTDGLVVCGEQGRAHVFNREGRHVTSFVLPPGGAQTRVRTGRWRSAEAEESAALRAALAAGTGTPA